MPRPADSPFHGLPGLGLAAALMLSACAAPRPEACPSQARAGTAAPQAPAKPPEPPPRPATPATSATPALVSVLAYADKLRSLPAPELSAELEQLRQTPGPVAWLQASLLHAHKQPADLPRAMELAVQAQSDASAEGLQLQPLARLLVQRYGEQRRLEEQLDKQGRQLADVQKRLDQSTERLEALKAIERSLGKRSSPARVLDKTVP